MMISLKNNFRDCLAITALSILIIALLEVGTALIYKATSSKYFGSKIELYKLRTGHTQISRNVSTKNKITKIAIFGGSSSVGFASPFSFADLLNDPEYSKQNFHVTNYGAEGTPFTGDQAEIAKAVMGEYDIVIIYAGHNEFWNQVNARPYEEFLPNGQPISPPRIVNANRKERLWLASQSLGLRLSSFSVRPTEWSNLSHFFNIAISNSRTFWFSKRVAEKITSSLFRRETQIDYPKTFFYNQMFLSVKERQNLADMYKKNIIQIARMLKPHQKLVLATVLSNDLFPPLADFMENGTKSTNPENEKITKDAYSYLTNKNYTSLSSQIRKLPSGANKLYLEGMLCLGKVGFKKKSTSDCFSRLKDARQFDALPYRVVPEINRFIRSFSHNNVIIVDPAEVLNTEVNSLESYHSYFVDFQHPSPLGHVVIAEKILWGLFPEYSEKRTYKVDECGSIELNEESKITFIDISPKQCLHSQNESIIWLKKYIAAQPIAYPYNSFKLRAEAILKKVGEN